MIDFGKILKRAWHILWNYRILWIFGLLLALFAGGSSGSSSSSGARYNTGYQGVNPPSTNPSVEQMNQWFQQHLEPLAQHPLEHIATFIWIGVALFFFILIVSVIVALIRYPAEAAVIRMVDSYEQSGEKVGFGKGWKLGWTHRAFRMWWVSFLTEGLPGLIYFGIIVALGIGVWQSVIHGGNTIVIGVVALVIAFILLTVLFVLAMFFVRLLRQFFWRKLALEDTGTKAAFREGWNMFKRNWKSSLLMWLIMVGIKIAFRIVMVVVFFLLIPLYIVMAIPALIVAAIPAGIAFGIASLFVHGLLVLLIAAAVAVPFFFVIALLPLSFVQGWYMVYDSSAWTLAYREMKAMEVVAPASLPTPTA